MKIQESPVETHLVWNWCIISFIDTKNLTKFRFKITSNVPILIIKMLET